MVILVANQESWWLTKIEFILTRMFLTDKGYFNWIGITGLIAIGTFIWTIKFNKQKYRADLISKARVEWMDQVRPLLAEYLAAVPNYMYLYNLAMVENDSRARQQLTSKLDEIKRLYYELNLYVPNNKSNKLILDNINLLWGELSYIGSYYDFGLKKGKFSSKLDPNRKTSYEVVVDSYVSKLISDASKEASSYFKQEWEKVKHGK